MSKAAKNIMVRVIKKRVSEGEALDEILEGYSKLTDAEKQELREAVEYKRGAGTCWRR